MLHCLRRRHGADRGHHASYDTTRITFLPEAIVVYSYVRRRAQQQADKWLPDAARFANMYRRGIGCCGKALLQLQRMPMSLPVLGLFLRS